MNSTHVLDIAPRRNVRRPRKTSIQPLVIVPDVAADPRYRQMARLMSSFQMSNEHAAVLASLAYPEGDK